MDDAMALFRTRARATNLKRVDVIAEALQAMRHGALSGEGRVEARRAAHSVAGSAGTFGFAGATELARTLETLLDDGGPHSAAHAERAQEYVTQLRAALSITASSTLESRPSTVGEEGP